MGFRCFVWRVISFKILSQNVHSTTQYERNTPEGLEDSVQVTNFVRLIF